MTSLSAIEIEVLRNGLSATAAEMDVTIWRTSRSTIVRELLDYSTAVFDADGYNLAQSARIPMHLNSMGAGLRELIERFIPIEEWAPGDVIITNDPYCGGQHLPDILAFRPVFRHGQRIAIVGTLCHHIDMGGSAAGSYGAAATEIFQEGLRIPPMRLRRAGVLNPEVWAMLLQNVRKPDLVAGDLNAQLASLSVGEANIQRLAEKYGIATFLEAGRRILDMSEAAMRDAIRRIPDGIYSFTDFVDDDGISDASVRLEVKLEVRDDEIHVDLSGCAPQVAGPINATPSMASCAIYYAVIACADEPIPANAGCYRPVRVSAPAGTVVSASHPAPVAHRICTIHRLANTIMGALAKAVPDRIPAAYYGVSYVCTFQTIDETGDRKVLVEIEIGGAGGHPSQDGPNTYSSGMHNNSNIPVEMIESDMPITLTGYGLVPDSGGAGRHRGGLGLWREWRIDAPQAAFTCNLDRFKHAPYGLAGGEPGSLGRLTLLRGSEQRSLGSKVTNFMLGRGDVIRLETSGGGGWGLAEEREPAARERDRILGYVSTNWS
jgi:N-methylhydantoinase B